MSIRELREAGPRQHPSAPRTEPFAVIVRLMWIDGVIDNDGEINRSEIRQAFNVSTPQASLDLRRYMELNPGRIAYDVRGKRYVQVAGTRPLYKRAQQEAAAEMVRQVDAAILRALEQEGRK